MAQISTEIRIDATPEKVWEVLSDIGSVSAFSPNVEVSHATTEETGGIGAGRHCDFYGGGEVDEVVIDWIEGEKVALEILGGFGPAASIAGSFAIRPEGDGSTVTFQATYEMKFGLLGKLMDVAIARRQFGKLGGQILDGLKHHVETGDTIADDVPTRALAGAAI